MRWPFGPPHLPLKPSKKNKKKNNKKQKKNLNKTKKNIKKWLFQLSVKNSYFLVGVQKFPFLTTWPRKRAPPKHYKNRGFSTPIFEKQLCVTKRPFLDKKNKIHKFQLSFFLPFSSLSTTNNTKICWNLYFYSVFANLKKREFSKIQLKAEKFEKPNFCTLFFSNKKGYF